MMRSNSPRNAVGTCSLLLLAFAVRSPAIAAPVTYDIVTESSQVTLSATLAPVGGSALVPQASGADTTSLDGVIVGDLDSGVLTFSGGSTIVCIANPVLPFLPGLSGGTDQIYGLAATGGAFGPFHFSVWDATADITGGTVTNGSRRPA